MRKVGVLTYHSSYNFGAGLQALGVQEAIRKIGLQPIMINYQDSVKMDTYKREVPPEQAEAHETYMKKYFNLSPLLIDANEVEKYCIDELDAVVVGSDAVFRLKPKFLPRNILKKLLHKKSSAMTEPITKELPLYWLSWKKPTGRKFIKASIAASCTGTNYLFLQRSILKKLKESIIDFDFVSVRDQWTKNMLHTVTLGKIKPVICPDPALVLKTLFKIPDSEMPKDDYSKTILVSGDFPRYWIKRFVSNAHCCGYNVAGLPNPENPYQYVDTDFNVKLPMSPLQWYSTIACAAGFVGIRFHALVTCVSNNVPIICAEGREKFRLSHKRRSRLYDLCNRIGITENYIFLDEIIKQDPNKIIESLFLDYKKDLMRLYTKNATRDFLNITKQIKDLICY